MDIAVLRNENERLKEQLAQTQAALAESEEARQRLEGCKFVWPQVRNGVMRISPAMFAALFEGLDWRLVRPEGSRRPQLAG